MQLFKKILFLHVIFLIVFMAISLCVQTKAFAQDLGTIGTTYPIAEDNILEVMQNKLQQKPIQQKITAMQQQLKNKVLTKNYRPKKVHVKNASRNKSYTFDPSTSIPNDLKDDQGKIFYHANTKVNPLDFTPLPQELLFIDGDNAKHLQFAKQYLNKKPHQVDIILTNGAPFKIMQALQHQVYFDQGGALIKHLQIQAIPATVKQQQKHLLIEEIAL